MYRKKEWKRNERKKLKRDKKGNWYKKGGFETVVFVPCTPRSELRKMYETIIKGTNIKMKVVEKRGQTLRDRLNTTSRMKEKECKDKDNCMMCRDGGSGKCRTNNITYTLTCKQCKDIYIGETNRNAYTRGKEHESQMRRKDKNSVMNRHQQQKHADIGTPNFEMKITGIHRTALERQITEAVQINRQPTNRLINNKSEFRQNKIMRTQLIFE